MDRTAQFVGISEPIPKQRTYRRLPAIELPVVKRVVNTTNYSKANNTVDSKSPSMIYESFKGLRLTSRPTSQANKARFWQELNNHGNGHGSSSFDLHNLQDLTLQLSSEQSAGGEDLHSDLDNTEAQSVTFRFSFKTMDTNTSEDKENQSRTHTRSQPSRSSRFTTLETAADKENQKLGLSPLKMTPLQSPRNVVGNPLESLSIGQRPIKSDDPKTAKKRLLRKPLPLNHYKKSQKVRILQNSDVSGLVSVGQVTSTHETNDTESLKKSSGVYSSVSEWLNNIEGQEFDKVSSNGDPQDTDQLDENLDNKQDTNENEQSETDQLSQELNSALAMKIKNDPKFSYTKNSSSLPDISDKLLRPNPKMREFQGRMSKMGEFEPIESDDEEYNGESSSQKSEDVHFPTIRNYNRDSHSARSDTSSKLGETTDVKLPRLLLDNDSDGNSEELERQRLKLIHLANPPDTVRSEPMYLPGQYMYINKGASSSRYAKKQMSLKEMAASFQRKMAHSMDYPDHSEGKKILTDKLTRHTSVIDQNTYDYFARKNKPKPATFSPGIQINTGKNVKPKEITFPKNSERIYGSEDPALELNYAKLKHSLRRETSNVSTNSLSTKRRRSGSQDRLRRSNSMTSITSSCYGHTSRRDSSHKDSATRQRRRGRSHSKHRSRSRNPETEYD